jgi:hypothetical protein
MMTMDAEQRNAPHDLDRRAGESDEQFDARINEAAAAAGQSRAEYEKAANERAGRPPITRGDGDQQQASGIL